MPDYWQHASWHRCSTSLAAFQMKTKNLRYFKDSTECKGVSQQLCGRFLWDFCDLPRIQTVLTVILVCVQEFLIEIQATRCVDFGALSVILVEKAGSPDDTTRLTSIKWLKEFVSMARTQLVRKSACSLCKPLQACIVTPGFFLLCVPHRLDCVARGIIASSQVQ